MSEIKTANSMLNILSCSTLITLKTTNIIPVTNYSQAVKAIRNIESDSIGIKSLSGSCDIKVKDKLGYFSR
jgi:pyruvate/oxaloacetate carboxyltransferase